MPAGAARSSPGSRSCGSAALQDPRVRLPDSCPRSGRPPDRLAGDLTRLRVARAMRGPGTCTLESRSAVPGSSPRRLSHASTSRSHPRRRWRAWWSAGIRSLAGLPTASSSSWRTRTADHGPTRGPASSARLPSISRVTVSIAAGCTRRYPVHRRDRSCSSSSSSMRRSSTATSRRRGDRHAAGGRDIVTARRYQPVGARSVSAGAVRGSSPRAVSRRTIAGSIENRSSRARSCARAGA
jgi:hypothetical protein